jgi:hypothetical protein
MNQSVDTSAAARTVQIELLRRMSPVERLLRMTELTLAVQQIAFAELRRRYPEAPDDELWLRLAVRRLGRDLVRAVYGRDLDPV